MQSENGIGRVGAVRLRTGIYVLGYLEMGHVRPTLPEVTELVGGQSVAKVDAPAVQFEVGQPLRHEGTLVAPELGDHQAWEVGVGAGVYHGRAEGKHGGSGWVMSDLLF